MFPDVDENLKTLFLNAENIKMWRLYNHDPYDYWVRGRCALLGMPLTRCCQIKVKKRAW
jgi:salicylate hydroxylase